MPKRRYGIRSPALASLPTSGPGIRVQHLPGGRTIVSGESRGGKRPRNLVGPLQITTRAPLTYGPEGAPSGVPIFVTWGTVGGLIPAPEVFSTPIGYVTSTGTRYVWAKIGLSNTAVLVATSLAFVTHTSSSGYATANFETDGTPPEFMYVPLGQFTATGAELAITISNSGSGSLVVSMHLSNVTTNDAGAVTAFTRHLSFWRTPNA